jgi:hypothetical protein
MITVILIAFVPFILAADYITPDIVSPTSYIDLLFFLIFCGLCGIV